MPMPMSREELAAAVDLYMDALVARDPSRLPLAHGFRYTENGQALALGDGLWGTASGMGGYRHVVIDERSGQAALVAVVHENGLPVIFALRLMLGDGMICQAEAIVSRSDILFYRDGPANLEAMGGPAPLWDEIVPPEERMSRVGLIAIANSYLDTLECNDGHHIAPFEPECRRLDNGVYATQAPEFDKPDAPPFYGLGPADQFALGYFAFVTRIRERRFPVVDQARGIVATLPFIDHAGIIHEVTLRDGRTVPINLKQPYSWQVMELFKIRHGRIAAIEVVLNMVPYGMASGWDVPDRWKDRHS